MSNKILFILISLWVLTGCEDIFEPAIENNRPLEDIYNEPRFAQGLIINGYARIPTNGYIGSDMATDNAVSNNENSNFYAMANGQWAANMDPLNQWTNSKAAIQYLNLMLAEADNITYSATPVVNQMFADRIKGESYGLRALFMYYLLQAHGGMAGGNLLGVPIILEPENTDSDFNQPRATFEACIQQIYDDVEMALELLPLDYANLSDNADVPLKYLDEDANFDDYNRAFGDDARLLMSGRIAMAIRAQAALLAASPAFASGTTTSWADAAAYSAEVIDLNGGVAGLSPDGVNWYTDVDGVSAGINPPEILWRTDMGNNNDLESQNYPPTLFGDGLLNPTQNLVDAFPMANGYPITDPASGYDPLNPYANRDPRLLEFVLVNGSTAGPNGTVISTAVDGGTNDGLNQVETSTRTGYYLRKMLRQDVNLDPIASNTQLHINPRIRYTEIYLMYAEAANEAYGPQGAGPSGYSAYDVIRAIRERAGVGTANNHAFLDAAATDTDAMRELIRNERRLELCFEGFRFWDLRRWNEDLTEAALGVSIEGGIPQIISVDNRVFADHMIYGPIPYSETLKYSALEQNTGW